MLSFASIVVLLAVLGYTTLLVVNARRARRWDDARDFLDGGQYSTWQVFTLVSALWCSSIFVVEMETGYLLGVSALWFGFGTVLMALVTGYLVPTFRRLGYLTSSGVIGARFGTAARVLSGLVIGLTFPIFAMSNVLGAAGFLQHVARWPLPATLALAVLVIVGYVGLGGMAALARAQAVNLGVMTVGLLAAVAWAVHSTPIGHLSTAVPAPLLSPAGAGASLIITWVSSALLNVVNAQAELQILTAARDNRSARRGLHAALVFTSGFTIAAVAVGIAARSAAGPHQLGIVAIPSLFDHAPTALLAVVALAVWVSALTWSAPLMLSGAISLGVDVLRPLLTLTRRATPRTLPFYVRVSLVAQGLLVVGFALLRPADLAWWRIFGQTVRTGALFGVTVAVLALPTISRRTALGSILTGTAGGLGWNLLTGFSADHFALGINPMWIGASIGMIVLAAGALAGHRHQAASLLRAPGPIALILLATGDVTALTQWPQQAARAGLSGPGVLIAAGALLTLAWLAHQPTTERDNQPAAPSLAAVPSPDLP
jgi:SSS family solute:Na+ symporter